MKMKIVFEEINRYAVEVDADSIKEGIEKAEEIVYPLGINEHPEPDYQVDGDGHVYATIPHSF
jgi:hypothetical protein